MRCVYLIRSSTRKKKCTSASRRRVDVNVMKQGNQRAAVYSPL